MKLFGFGRKKEEIEDSGSPEQESGEQEAEAEPEKRSGRKGKGRAAGSVERAAANIEKISAKVEALSELRRTDAELFSRISEQIGELRNLILDKEAEIKEIGAKAVKAAETIEELQPENLLAEARKSETRYQVLEAKIEAANALYNRAMEELKAVRKRLAMFHGVEELMKLNEETSSNLANIKRIEANIESYANKSGNIYAQFQKQAGELVRYRDAAAARDNEFKGVKNAVEELKVKAQSALIGQEDLNKLRADLRNELNKKFDGVEKNIKRQREGTAAVSSSKIEKELEDMKKRLETYSIQKKPSEQLVVDTLREARERLARREEDVRGIRAELSSLKERVHETSLEIQKGRGRGRNEQPEQEEVPGMENETAADFQDGLSQLQKAIREGNPHIAITLYNQLRESYVHVARSSLPDGRKHALRRSLLDMHKTLSSLVSAQQTFRKR